MATFGYFLSSEEHGANALVRQAQLAEDAGMESVWISDHYHPWLHSQGESPFVWSTIGGIAATTGVRVTTAVTCPTIRIHPAVIAQAAATSATMLEGRFNLGIGTGENLNEHVLGDHWPPAEIRLEMLEEAVEVMRLLWTGESITHHGRYYTVENARIYSLPDEPVPVPISAFGPKATNLAARIGDGYMNTSPDDELVRGYVDAGGKGPKMAGVKVCWGDDEATCVKLAHDTWRTSGVPGQLSQDLQTPEHFEMASELVTPEMIADKIPCGPDPERHAGVLRKYVDAGYDEIYINQIGPDQEGFFSFYRERLAPMLS
jgi:G6PDH family F420-dependent oxidoreductase